jgi:hypothetical protein
VIAAGGAGEAKALGIVKEIVESCFLSLAVAVDSRSRRAIASRRAGSAASTIERAMRSRRGAA